jgi:hypothetical protein
MTDGTDQGIAADRAIGPILHWRGRSEGRVRLEVAASGPRPAPLDAEAPLRVEAEGSWTPLGQLAGLPFWAAGLSVPEDHAGPVRYRFEGRGTEAHLPGAGGALRLAFASCNGAEDADAIDAMPGGAGAMWRRLAARHAERPFHLLALGGDQIYADALWHLPSFEAWAALPHRARHAAPFTEEMRAELEAHYLATYVRAFGEPDVAEMLAAIPTLMMWDDHDIVDGWGSRPAEWQASPVARGLWETARRAFALVQLGREAEAPAPYGWDAGHGCAHVITPDLRSERTRRRVMGPEGHARLEAALARAAGAPHVLLVSSVPLVNADLSPVERLVGPFQRLVDLYQDDLRDQWMSHAHRAEWTRVTERLLRAARERRVTVLSGEIHLAAQGTASGDGARIEQLIASGIAHPPPPRALARGYETFASLTGRRAGIRVAMHPLLPDGRRYLAERNWLELEARPDGGREAVLHGERTGALPIIERSAASAA